MKKKKIAFIIFAAITIAIEVLIMVESAFSGVKSSGQSNSFTQAIINFVEKIDTEAYIVTHPDEFKAFARKFFGHFLLFGGLGFFSMFTLSMLEDAYKDKKLQIILSCLSFGLASSIYSEIIQLFASERVGQIIDVLLDFSGFSLFSLAIFLILFIINKHREKKNVSTLG